MKPYAEAPEVSQYPATVTVPPPQYIPPVMQFVPLPPEPTTTIQYITLAPPLETVPAGMMPAAPAAPQETAPAAPQETAIPPVLQYVTLPAAPAAPQETAIQPAVQYVTLPAAAAPAPQETAPAALQETAIQPAMQYVTLPAAAAPVPQETAPAAPEATPTNILPSTSKDETPSNGIYFQK